ncbi:MAG: DNA mismatch repair endonuclease MutL [Victivallales bacterium]|nr:DNA mismatch repair endonuclease MutL [Victivallales bacterium]
MGNIHIMPSELVSRIAAGEVVERPASVVKELMENSIDAGASFIRVNIEQGGHRLIQIIDDGCGMDRSDAMLCLETHATSKVSGEGDVGHIATLGFRGEALPSIASISRFTMQTRRKEDQVGTEVSVDFGTIRDVRDCGCAVGTNIRVGQLFANLPARRKFLRGPDTEDGFIEEMVRLEALAWPDVTVLLTLNGREALRANATKDLGVRVAALLGREAFSAMLPVDYTENGITVRGFITRPGFTRSSRREQRVIVNGRPASADTIFFAIRESYENLIMKGRYPGATLYVDLSPERVDVNVHPTKREVRFREPREVGEVVSAALRRALRGMAGGADATSIPVRPEPQPDRTVQAPPAIQGTLPLELPPRPVHQEFPSSPPPSTVTTPPVPSFPPPVPSFPPATPARPKEVPANTGSPAVPIPPSGVRAGLKELRLVGRFGNGYALAEGPNGLVIVNLRFAHERILFERLLKHLNAREKERQPLLIPTTLNLGPDDARFLRNERERFLQLGFQVEPFGGNTFIVSAVPAGFPDLDIGQVVRDILDDLRHSSVTTRQSTLHLAETACRHAITRHDSLTDQQLVALLQQLASTDMPYASPGGNPTMIVITPAELEKRFHT